MKIWVILFLMTLSTCAWSTGEGLKIYIVPSAEKLDWSSSIALIRSFQKSQVRALRNNHFKDAQRKAIGHVISQITCSGETRWTSISIDPMRMIPLILKQGISGMFSESSHGYMQKEDEMKKFLENNAKDALVMKFSVSEESCRKMLRMDDEHRSQTRIWFGPLIDTFAHYESRMKLGGSGTTYAVALKKWDETVNVDMGQWIETVTVPGRKTEVSFYSVQKMWEFAHFERATFPARAYSEKINKADINGIEF
jgi:hypothetical protein